MAKRKRRRRQWRQYEPVDDQGRLRSHCGQEPRVLWQKFKNGEYHCRVECSKCGRFLGYAPRDIGLQRLENIATPTSRPFTGTHYVQTNDTSCPFDP